MRKTKLKYGRFGLNTLALFVIGGLLIIISGELSFAQPGLPEPPEQTPIDGGLGILAAIGGAYAIKKLRNKE